MVADNCLLGSSVPFDRRTIEGIHIIDAAAFAAGPRGNHLVLGSLSDAGNRLRRYIHNFAVHMLFQSVVGCRLFMSFKENRRIKYGGQQRRGFYWSSIVVISFWSFGRKGHWNPWVHGSMFSTERQ